MAAKKAAKKKQAAARKKKGGSNVGKYKGVKAFAFEAMVFKTSIFNKFLFFLFKIL